jgi:recombination protein RecR
MNDIEPIAKLVNQLARLPGIGRKTATRLAYHIIALPEDQVRELAVSIFNGKKQVHFCPVCGDYTDTDPCKRCADPSRDRAILCVVKDPRDVAAMERMRDFNGLYHVLHGVISPMDGVGPDDIRIRELMTRLASGEVREVVLATNPDIEGEATAAYIARLVKPMGVKVTRIAHGVPVGGELEYTDEVTLSKAFENRREI